MGKMKVKNALSALMDLLFPPRCIFCREVIPSGAQICKKCGEEISHINAVKYMNVPEAGKAILCIVPYPYSGQVRQSIIRFKFQGQKQFASFYGEKIGELIQKSKLNLQFDVITSVPISAQRRKLRGYNQSELIARTVAGQIDLPYRDYLIKTTDNKEQHKLSEKERLKNVRGVYRSLHQEEFFGKRILLVDDIVTTGATLSECALVLLRGGAKEVSCAAVAQVVI
jgi:competence protein ComFC